MYSKTMFPLFVLLVVFFEFSKGDESEGIAREISFSVGDRRKFVDYGVKFLEEVENKIPSILGLKLNNEGGVNNDSIPSVLYRNSVNNSHDAKDIGEMLVSKINTLTSASEYPTSLLFGNEGDLQKRCVRDAIRDFCDGVYDDIECPYFQKESRNIGGRGTLRRIFLELGGSADTFDSYC